MITRTQTLGAVDPDVCLAIQCGAMTQQEAGFDLLFECSQAGYAGALAWSDPRCAQFFPTFTAPAPEPESAPAPEPEPEPTNGGGLIVCAADVKVCPDGTVLSRQPPDCRFPPCPQPEPPAQEILEPVDEEEQLPAGFELIGTPGEIPIPEPLTGALERLRELPELAKQWPWWYWLLALAALWLVTRQRKRKR